MYTVQHYRKIKTAVGLRNVVAHNMRHNIYDEKGKEIANEQTEGKWYAPERGKLNQYDKSIKKPEQALKKRADRIKDADLTRKPQKNAAYAVEGVFSASPEFQEAWASSRKDRKTWEKYLKESQKWAEQTFGKENVLHTAVHMDEKTPHLHVVMVPIMTKKGRNTYSSSQFLGGRKGMRELQTVHHQRIGRKYGLNRGIEGSRKRHEYITGLAKKEKEVQRREAEIKKNSHLIHRDPVRNLQVPEEKLWKKLLLNFNTTDGQEMSWNKYKEYQFKLNTVNYIKDIEVRNQVLKRESEMSQKSATESYQQSYSLSQKLSKYRNASPADLRVMADQKEQKILKQRELNRYIDNSRGGIGH